MPWPSRWLSLVCLAFSLGSAVSTGATGDSGWKHAATSSPIGRECRILRPHSGTSVVPGRSSGSTRRPVWPVRAWRTGRLDRGRAPRGRPCPMLSWLGSASGDREVRSALSIGSGGPHPPTRITNKPLLPIYDRPMINWCIEALVHAEITEIMLVTGGTHAGEFLRLLGNGYEFGIDRLSYGYQEKPGGIAEALGLAAWFVDG